MIYYPIYEELFDDDDNIYDYIAGIIIFEEKYLCNNFDNSGKEFHTSVGRVENYIGDIRDLDNNVDYCKEYSSSTLSGAQHKLIKLCWLDFK